MALTGASTRAVWAGPVAVMELPGEIDIGTVRAVDEELNSLLGRRPGAVVVDLTKTRFCDSSGIAALLRAWRRASVLAVPFRLACSEPVLQLLRLVRADEVLEIYPTVTAAAAGRRPG
jgi:anti-sigma B factor antagonist